MDYEKVLTEDPRVPFLELNDFFKGAVECEVLGYDNEGTGKHLDDGRDFAYGASLAYYHPHLGRVAHYLPFRMPYGYNLPPQRLEQFKETMRGRADTGKPITTHNLSYDLSALESLTGYTYDGYAWDTLVWAQLINENWPLNKNLENCAQLYLNVGKINNPPKGTWKYQSADMIYSYARQDAILHLDLALAMKPLMDKENLLDYVWNQKYETLQILREMKKRGIEINKDLCASEYEIGTGLMADITDILGFNPGSSKQLGEYLIGELGLPILKRNKLTPQMALKGIEEGNPSFDNATMEEYDEILERIHNPTAELIKEYRGWSKVTSSCYRAYLDKVSPDGRIRTNYHQHRTKTGRLSSSDPNLQQIPRQSSKPWQRNVKRAFNGKPGFTLLEADYSQLELRLGAAYAGEMRLLEVLNDDSRDIFDEMTKALRGELTYDLRQETKVETYTTLYGGGVPRLMNVFGLSEEEAARRKRNFEVTYPRLKAASDKAAAVAKRKKRIQLWNGRYRHMRFPSEAHKMFNSVMQGGAADIVECTMARCKKEIDNPDCQMLLQVHDSIWWEVKEDRVDLYAPEIKRVMENVKGPNGEDFGVKFKVDIHPVAH